MTGGEFSRRVALSEIPARGLDLDIAAEAGERAALARRFAILDLRSLTARVRLRPIAGGDLVRMTGRLAAEVVQSCVVSLEPVESAISEDFDLTFGSAGAEDGDLGEFDFDAPDPPDPIVGGAIDAGEAVAEQLALALDPFPRAGDAVFTPPLPAAPERNSSPFAALARLKKDG
jgi:uncharacterized metal-binding protein YceD (DUF177 family)